MKMEEEERRNGGIAIDHQNQPQYGTFQGVASFPPPRPPKPPSKGFSRSPSGTAHCGRGYQTVQGYMPVDGRLVREKQSLPCFGIGVGWFLFIIGWLFFGIPWYVGAVVILCYRVSDPREKPGYIACTIGAAIATIAILLAATADTADEW